MPNLNGNWIDLLIIVIVIYFITEALRFGFWTMFADFLAFGLSLVFSISSFSFVAQILRTNFALSNSFSNLLGFLITAIAIGSLLNIGLSFLVKKIPEKFHTNKVLHFAGVLPAIGEALVIVSFVLSLVINLPIPFEYKEVITDSKVGGLVLTGTSGLNSKINETFGKAVEDSLTHLIIRPGSRETVNLSVGSRNLVVDMSAEQEMFVLVNTARNNQKLPALTWDEQLVQIGRDYAKDMWERGYFGHYSPEGEDVAVRLEKANIDYITAGENLALAPTVTIAQTGLMNSDGHRANILDSNFNKIGIGVMDNGVYGKIFVQIFTD